MEYSFMIVIQTCLWSRRCQSLTPMPPTPRMTVSDLEFLQAFDISSHGMIFDTIRARLKEVCDPALETVH